ncbi:hypothetical protein PP178_03480 [Zeaxanthinibacter sp. PT1]|uniref:hypothetical protein n=1 Tax=Zeaxanthinibacter TaxID=561554 RepID=UPI00234970DB|nr:hypothetical protein [Zeaxanthinibacter sp. PT1]MDC6350601.1 hypothetical protein [Zeaxanthinibacter sp. PT1]
MAINSKLDRIFRDKEGKFKLSILQHPLYAWGLLFKIVLSFLFAGRLMSNAFIPFVTYFLSSGLQDPYTYFFEQGITDAFPYPPLMLYVLSALGGGLAALSPFFIRIPLLLADTLVLLILSRWLGQKNEKLLRYYWWSPVLIYISYIHGQFDVIPIAFLFAATYLLIKNRFWLSAAVLGLGLATKTNLVLTIPFVLLFLWKAEPKGRVMRILVALSIMGLTFLIPSLPFLTNDSYRLMVYHNQEQSKVWSAGITTLSQLQFYLIPAVYLIILAVASRFRRFSKDLFVMFIGFSFATLLLFIPPQPGWYFWILPFLIYFNIKEQKLTYIPVLALQFAFLLFFGLLPTSDYGYVFLWTERGFSIYEELMKWGIVEPALLVNLSFTLLQTVLVLNVIWILKAGIGKNINKKLRTKPFLVGIGGDSGVGKSTLTELLTALFGKSQVTIIRGDDMHRWERGHDRWNDLTHLSPKANHLHEDIKQLKLLRTGKSIRRRLYDHGTGKFTEPFKIHPQKLVIFEGLHPFYIAAKRNLFDLKVFVEPEEDLRLYWKLKRDIAKRGYTKEKVIEQLRMREEDSEKYIRSQASFSDIRLRFYPLAEVPPLEAEEVPELGLKIELDTNIDINYLVEAIGLQSTLILEHEYETDCQTLNVRGRMSKEQVERLMLLFVDDMNELFDKEIIKEDLNGFLQLFFIYCILAKADNP